MGCINSDRGFEYWFGNIHLSGPCNRSCYFCIGQHMMGLDKFNNLKKWPLDGLPEFIDQCNQRGVTEVNLTGTNTDPLLYEYHEELTAALRNRIPGVRLGIRTNGVLGRWSNMRHPDYKGRTFHLYDKGSITFPSFDSKIYAKMMGSKEVPDIERIIERMPWMPKINIVLSPYLTDLRSTLERLDELGISHINLREPYGQPHVGDPLVNSIFPKIKNQYGMPVYRVGAAQVCYWDVHYCEVESVNLYASGRVSLTYPITKGYAEDGAVIPQDKWGTKHQRHVKQWVKK